MGRPRNPNTGMVVAREACVITVGSNNAEYEMIEVIHNKTGQRVQMPSDRVVREAKEGTFYAFKQYQRVHPSHPAVKESPGSFIPISELDDAALELVSS